MKQTYLELIQLIERLHRQFLEVVKAELDRLGFEDINNVQSLILANIGEEDLTVGELTYRGYYLGSNVSYNVKKLVENGYLMQERFRPRPPVGAGQGVREGAEDRPAHFRPLRPARGDPDRRCAARG